VSNSERFAPNFSGSLLAVAHTDGSIEIFSMGDPYPPVRASAPAPNDRLFNFFWSFETNVLVAVRESGKIEVYLLGRLLTSTSLERIGPAVAACFDSVASRLFLSDVHSMFAILFAKKCSEFAIHVIVRTESLSHPTPEFLASLSFPITAERLAEPTRRRPIPRERLSGLALQPTALSSLSA
jgi:hypothetical protein